MLDTAPLPYQNNADVLSRMIDLAGKKIADVGCGDGALTRMMTRHGARIIGVECNPAQIEKARAEKSIGNETYVEGVAEKLPLPDGTLDAVVFFNSLHHVPVDAQDQALAEAARALKPGGYVYIAEPLAEGPHFELNRPVHDETEVRARAYDAIGRAAASGLQPIEETRYVHTALHKDFAAFKERTIRINAGRASAVEAQEDALKDAFARLGTRTDKGFAFDQPMRVNLLQKSG